VIEHQKTPGVQIEHVAIGGGFSEIQPRFPFSCDRRLLGRSISKSCNQTHGQLRQTRHFPTVPGSA
jgi:hypothetical protein